MKIESLAGINFSDIAITWV